MEKFHFTYDTHMLKSKSSTLVTSQIGKNLCVVKEKQVWRENLKKTLINSEIDLHTYVYDCKQTAALYFFQLWLFVHSGLNKVVNPVFMFNVGWLSVVGSRL